MRIEKISKTINNIEYTAEFYFEVADYKVNCFKNGILEITMVLPTIAMAYEYIDLYCSGGLYFVKNKKFE
jgi:hypothetical protein